MMRIIGLTGGIASGKSTVAALLEERGAAVIDSDALAREVVEPGKPAYEDIVSAFGTGVLRPDGTLDRAKLGAVVFADEAARALLNQATHPRIRALMGERLEALRLRPHPPAAAVLMIPLLFENRLESLVEETWLVALSPEEQIKRLMGRDAFSASEAESRLQAQMPLDEKLKRADRVIWNEGDRQELAAQVARAWDEAGLTPGAKP